MSGKIRSVTEGEDYSPISWRITSSCQRDRRWGFLRGQQERIGGGNTTVRNILNNRHASSASPVR